MLNAYRGIYSDRYPVAPEFWAYYPAKVLGVDMIELERKVPHWQALLATFKKYKTEGWGCADAKPLNPDARTKVTERWLDDGRYEVVTSSSYKNKVFQSIRVYDKSNPSWCEEYPVKRLEDISAYMDMTLSPDIEFDFTDAIAAHKAVGEDYLLEFGVGIPFFDFIAASMGFETAIMCFSTADQQMLEHLQHKYAEYVSALIDNICRSTTFESIFMGCLYSCPSLIGPHMWRKWDKPHITVIAQTVHKHGKVMHIHYHGNCLETLEDLAETAVDCVCPFERPPGGDIDGIEGLKLVRNKLADKVTMNGNVHTVETLIRGTPEMVREEVRQIKEAFTDTPRMIIGTGDQVGHETPEENILAMIEEAKLTQVPQFKQK